jgi:hypothetical protein
MTADDNQEFEGLPLFSEPSFGELAREYPQVAENFANLDPILTAAKLGGLLLVPELQANSSRLEVLAHLAVACCKGQEAPGDQVIRESFNHLGKGYCGMMEDPAEDVFAVLVNTPKGNFRIVQGTRESPGFFLQRFLNIVETMPRSGQLGKMRESIEGLLALSDAVAARAGVSENTLGLEIPQTTFPVALEEKLAGSFEAVRFTANDLARLGISAASLSEFSFPLKDEARILNQFAGNSDLERRPIGLRDDCYFLLLPTAVPTAVSRLLIETVTSLGLRNQFESALASEYGALFGQSRVLGGRLPGPYNFVEAPGGRMASFLRQVDPGRFFHLVLFVDGLEGFLEDGFCGMNAAPEALSAEVSSLLNRAAEEVRKTPGFVDGLTLLVGCGYGRSFVLAISDEPPPAWRLQFVGAQDLNTLNWLDGFDALSIWSLLEARRAAEEQGVVFLNANGLLNLVAWSRQLDGQLIPHARLPDEFGESAQKKVIVVHQNALRQLRFEVVTQWNPRRVLDAEGNWVKVLKVDSSPFEDDRRLPFYASEEDVHRGKLRGVYVAPNRPWWIDIDAPDSAPKDSVFQHWTMLSVWLARIAPTLDSAFQALAHLPVSIRVSFEEIPGLKTIGVSQKDLGELRTLLEISTDPTTNRIELAVRRGFHDGFFQLENVGERALVEAIVLGIATLSGEEKDLTKVAEMTSRICHDPAARQIHRFEARDFRDYARESIPDKPTLIDKLDDAAFRTGLGWKARSRESGGHIKGIRECTAYLNAIVQVVLDELCALLRQLDRQSFVTYVILNHESAAYDREIWKRTTQAVLALHDDKAKTIKAILEHYGQLNVCSTASRILIEAAICECPFRGGRDSGRLDLSRAMALAMLAFHYGGWSDGIHWGAIEPYVRIRPLGDIHVKHDFMDLVYEPFGRAVGEVSTYEDAKTYAELYSPAKPQTPLSDLLGDSFLDAWNAEFKVSLEGFRSFIYRLENADHEPVRAMRACRLSTLAELLSASAGLPLEDASASVGIFCLPHRPVWRAAGESVIDKDWFPWRYRRRLSVLRRPFIAIDSEDDPTILVVPGLIADAFFALVRAFHRGEIPEWQARSKEMLQWIGRAKHLQRTAFNTEVAQRMRELGWQAEPEMKITKILRKSLDRNYGDVDVLAWSPSSGRILAIECKDLQFNKTLGEVAEQLSDFRGATSAEGRRDALKKHLDRLAVLEAHRSEVSAALDLGRSARIEGHLVFKNPVPMRFAWDEIATRVKLSLFADLHRI